MRELIAIALKDLMLAMRDRLGLFFMIGFPVAMGIFFGAINGGLGKQQTRMTLAIVDEDQTTRSSEFIETLRTANDSVTLQTTTREQAVNAVRQGKVAGAIVIPAGFGESIGLFATGTAPQVEVAVDPSRTAEAGLLQGMLLQAAGETTFGGFRDPKQMRELMQRSRQQLDAVQNIDLATRLALQTLYGSLDALADRIEEQQNDLQAEGQTASGSSSNGAGLQLLDIKTLPLTRSRGVVDRLRSGWDRSIPASSLWAVLGCTAVVAQSLVRERTRGTLLRLQVAPLKRWQLLGGKALACCAMAVAVMAAMMILGIALGMRPKDPAQLIVAIALVAWAFVGVMMVVSVIGKTEEAVGGGGWGLNVIMAMLGGGMIPLAFLPSWMKTLSDSSPVKWGVLSLEGAVWREFTWSEALVPWLVLLGIGIAGFVIGILRLRQLDRAA